MFRAPRLEFAAMLHAARSVSCPCLLALAALAGTTFRTAHAASVPFVASTPEFFGGVILQTSQIWVDANGDRLENAGDTHHSVPNLIDSSWDLGLSPTRRIMTAVQRNGAIPSTHTAEIRMFAIPRGNVPMTELGSQQHLNGWPNSPSFFDPDTTAPFRTAYFVEVPNSGTSGQYLWWDLVTGAVAHSAFNYLTPYGFVEFAPSGTMAFAQHDVNGPGGTNYSIVKLCPAGIGQSSQPGFEYSGVLHAFYETGTVPATVGFYENGTLITSAPYEDCQISNPLGACCRPDGTCSQTTAGGCSGTWSVGAPCTIQLCPPPPAASLALTLTGPATAIRGSQITYTLTASNGGNLASNSVSITDAIPSNTGFVSASNGGVFNAGNGTVTWSLGTLGASSQAERTLVVQAPCLGNTAVNNTYSITGTPGGTIPGTPSASTTLLATDVSGFTVTLLSQALSTPPLQTGNRVRYTVRMTNSLPVVRPALNFTVHSGSASRIFAVVSAGGGSAITSPTSLIWTGDVPASSMVDVVYETEITDCRPAVAATEICNDGPLFFVRNGCLDSFGFGFPTQSFAVAPSPLQLRLETTSHGPAQVWSSTTSRSIVVCRPADVVTLELRFINLASTAGPVSTASVQLPAELTAANPPFAGSPPPGVSWNSGTRVISWAGTPPPHDSLRIAFNVTVAASACRGDLNATAEFAGCTGVLSSTLSLAVVPVLPASYLVALRPTEGIWYRNPAGSQGWQSLLCGNFGNLRGIGRTPEGTLWVAGEPTFRLNPNQLSFQIFSPAWRTALGIDTPSDAAGDPRDSTVLITGYHTGSGFRLRRYKPSNGQFTVLLNDNGFTLGIGNRIAVAADGLIGVLCNLARVARIPPANPTAYQLFTPPGGGGLGGLDLDTDGNWLTTGSSASQGSPRFLRKVNATTGVYTDLVDLQSAFAWNTSIGGLAVEPDQDVYLGAASGENAVAHRAWGNVVAVAPPTTEISDLLWVGPPLTTAVEEPGNSAHAERLRLEAPAPNPAFGEVTLNFELPVGAAEALDIFDLQGRCVRRLGGAHGAGRHSVRWDGRDDAGRSAVAGLYFVRLTQGGRSATARIMLMR